jgi:hypothetical protein
MEAAYGSENMGQQQSPFPRTDTISAKNISQILVPTFVLISSFCPTKN